MTDAAQFMHQALKLAREALAQGELPIGAVVVSGEQIIAAAHTAELREQRLLVHAELLALDQADRLRPFPGRRRDAALFTTLEPCLMCIGAAMSFHVGRIYYALESPADGAVGLVRAWVRDKDALPSYRLPELHGGLLREQSIALFRAFAEAAAVGPMRD